MKKILLWGVMALLILAHGAAENRQPLIDAPSFRMELISLEKAEGQTALTLQCLNRTEEEIPLVFFAPLINDLPASFRYGWGAQDLPLIPGKEVYTLTLYSDDPKEWADTLSFRIVCGQEITVPMQIDLGQNPLAVQNADFDWMKREAALIAPLSVALDGHCPADPLIFTDTITAEQWEKLDYGQMQVCLRVQVDGQDCLMPFATIPASVSADGSATARFSGNALVSHPNPQFPLKTRETHEGNQCRYDVTGISLSGPFIFFSSLTLSLEHQQGAKEAVIIESALGGVETGILFDNLPLNLFDWMQASHTVQLLTPREDGNMRLQTVDVSAFSCDLDQPLAFSLIPAESLGEIYGYFEYFFLDQTDVIHPPFPLNLGE